MPIFEYRAQDANGRDCRGQQEAESARQARQLLRERGLRPTRLTQARQNPTTGLRARLGVTDLALVTRQLSTLIHAGLPLEEALGAVAAQSAKRHVNTILLAVRNRVTEGHALATALAAFPWAFPELFRATVAAGSAAVIWGMCLSNSRTTPKPAIPRVRRSSWHWYTR